MTSRFDQLNPQPSGEPDGKAAGLPLYRNPAARTGQQREALLADPGFGAHFTDHMVAIRWTAAAGLARRRRRARTRPLTLDPASSFIHYGQSIFEGLKAYRHPDGSIATFRPEANAARFQRSARRLAMAELPEDLFLESIDALLRGRRRLGPGRPGEVALPAAVPVRHRGRAWACGPPTSTCTC